VLECHETVILYAIGIDDDVDVALPAATDGGKWTGFLPGIIARPCRPD
jgi:hypothetical protein